MKLILCSCFLLIVGFWQLDNYAEAKRLFDNKQYEESIAICSKQLEQLDKKDSLFTKFLFLRVSSYTALKDFSAGIKDYLTLIEINPNEIRNYVGLSYIYGETNDYENGIAVLKKALEIEPNNIYTFNNLSYYYNQTGNYDNAIKYSEEGLKLVTDSYWKGVLLNNKGYGLIGLKKYNEALDNINEAINLNSDNSFAYCYRAIANIKLNHFETVCTDLNKAKVLGAETLTKDLIKQYCN